MKLVHRRSIGFWIDVGKQSDYKQEEFVKHL